MVDNIDVENDRKIADHVVRMHRYRNPREQDGDVLSIAADADSLTTKNFDSNADEEEKAPIYEKYDALLHGSSRKKTDKIVGIEFMKKYIHIAKCICPVLTDKASEVIAEEDAKLAIELVQFAYFKKVLDNKDGKRKHRDESESEEENEAGDGSTGAAADSSSVQPAAKKARTDTPSAADVQEAAGSSREAAPEISD